MSPASRRSTGAAASGGTAPPPEHQRIATARSRIAGFGADPSALAVVDRLAESVEACRAEQVRLIEVLDQVGGDRATRELKEALRNRPDPTAPDDARLSALRRRHESVHSLRNRLDELDDQITGALADLETFVVELATASSLAEGVGSAEASRQLELLTLDVQALAEARRELATW